MQGGSTYHLPFAFISATLPLPTQLLKPFDGAPIPSQGTCRRTERVRERESSQDENNSVDRKNLPSSFVSPLPPSILPSSRSPSLFATRYDDHDNKMCGEGGGGGGAILH